MSTFSKPFLWFLYICENADASILICSAARRRRLLELEVDERLQISRDELVEHEDGRDHDEAHEPEREHGESVRWGHFI